MPPSTTASGPHAGQPVLAWGKPLGQAPVVVIMIHGRGAGPENILDLAPALGTAGRRHTLRRRAANNTWYPYSFMTEIAKNEPFLSSALSVLGVAGVGDRRRRHPARSHRDDGLLAGRVPDDGVCNPERVAIRRVRRLQRRRDRAGRNDLGRSRHVGSTARRSSSAAAMSMRTFPKRACGRARRSAREWAPT